MLIYLALFVEDPEGFSYFVFNGVCVLDLFGHHVQELWEVYCAAPLNNQQ